MTVTKLTIKLPDYQKVIEIMLKDADPKTNKELTDDLKNVNELIQFVKDEEELKKDEETKQEDSEQKFKFEDRLELLTSLE